MSRRPPPRSTSTSKASGATLTVGEGPDRQLHRAARGSRSPVRQPSRPGGRTPRRHSVWSASSGWMPASMSRSIRSPTDHFSRLSISTGITSEVPSTSHGRVRSSDRKNPFTGSRKNASRSASATSSLTGSTSGPARNSGCGGRVPAAARAATSAVGSKVNGPVRAEPAGLEVEAVEGLERVLHDHDARAPGPRWSGRARRAAHPAARRVAAAARCARWRRCRSPPATRWRPGSRRAAAGGPRCGRRARR